MKWFSGVRGAATLVALWTVGWGLGFGGFAEVLDSRGDIIDVWPTVMAIPGFVGGLIFVALLAIAERRKSVAELPSTHLGLWGAVSGVILGGIAAVLGLNPPMSITLIQLACVFAALGAVAGFGTAVFVWFFARGGSAAMVRPQM